MLANDTIELFKQTETVIQYAITRLNHVLDYVSDSEFKMQLVNSRETLKERLEMLQEKAKSLQGYVLNIRPDLAHQSTSDASLSFDTDQTIASHLFDLCNNSVKEIYTYLNHYPTANEKATKAITESVKAIERLREHLADYL